jgi:hypothetical protein
MAHVEDRGRRTALHVNGRIVCFYPSALTARGGGAMVDNDVGNVLIALKVT